LTLSDAVSGLSIANTIEEKREFMKIAMSKSFIEKSNESLEPGSTFDIDKTYDATGFTFNGGEEWSNDEELIQSVVSVNYFFDKKIADTYEKTGEKKVYRGNPTLWTPLDKRIPEEEHAKIEAALRDYVEPSIYEDKYGTRKRREASLKPEEPQSNYVSLPRKSQYVYDGKELEFNDDDYDYESE